jgi:hypothetical protein
MKRCKHRCAVRHCSDSPAQFADHSEAAAAPRREPVGLMACVQHQLVCHGNFSMIVNSQHRSFTVGNYYPGESSVDNDMAVDCQAVKLEGHMHAPNWPVTQPICNVDLDHCVKCVI